MTIDTVPCPACDGHGQHDTTPAGSPSAPMMKPCHYCDGYGTRELVDCDMESLLEAGLEISKEDAIARLEAEGFNGPGEAEAIWRHYREETKR